MTEIDSSDHWTLVIQRVGTNHVELWVGTLHPNLRMPKEARVVISDDDGLVRERIILRHQWQRPFSRLRQRFFLTLRITGLRAERRYHVAFSRQSPAQQGSWQSLQTGTFTTLPEVLPGPTEKPFCVGFGSCFFAERDGHRVADAWRALYERGPVAARPDISFLLGDQVYLDIGMDSLSLRASEIRERIASDYEQHWRALAGLLVRGATWMLPDDHEFWNDYPFTDRLLPHLVALRLKRVRQVWQQTAADAVAQIQRPRRVETFAIGERLSFCLVDARSGRSAQTILPEQDLARVVSWARGLNGPGVLVMSQPLLRETTGGDRAWPDYPRQYARLLKALAHSRHDIVLMSGDAHFGRIAEVAKGKGAGRLFELVASPLSGLTGLSGLASAVATTRPAVFPSLRLPEWPPQVVTYHRRVSHLRGRLLSAYPKDRTREHFMTAAFSRYGRTGVQMEVQAWRVRETGRDGLPRPDFTEPLRVVLR